MKGFVKVSVVEAKNARNNYIKWKEHYKNLVEELIIKYYTQEYNKLSWWGKWYHNNDTPKQFLHSNMDSFSDYTTELYKVENNAEVLENIYNWCYAYKADEMSRSIRSLCNTTSDGILLLDQELAEFIEKWKENRL